MYFQMFKIHGCYWYLSKWLISVELSIFRIRHNFGHRVELGRGSQHIWTYFEIQAQLWTSRWACERLESHVNIFDYKPRKSIFELAVYLRCCSSGWRYSVVVLVRRPHYRACYLRTSCKSGSCAHRVVCASRVHEYSEIRSEVTVSESKSWWCCLRIPLEAQTWLRL